MKFDQVRREFKKTLWGEELDNESFLKENSQPFGAFQHNKPRCTNCRNECKENEFVIYRRQSICLECFQSMYQKS